MCKVFNPNVHGARSISTIPLRSIFLFFLSATVLVDPPPSSQALASHHRWRGSTRHTVTVTVTLDHFYALPPYSFLVAPLKL